MADWQRTLRLNPEWERAKKGEITRQELARSIAAKLNRLRDFGSGIAELNDERDGIAEEFEALADDKNATTQDFDSVMESLYDWGDQRISPEWNGKKVCWIDTMTKVETA